MTTIATAGHVDHGKSTLVQALTGVDPDRWAEEKERGLTIDLGFAATTLPSGQRISLVDVPGHERFIRNMLAGVGAVDACIFVVAATEGWKPQSEEHLRILELLGVARGVVALTKIGLVDEELGELAHLDVEDHVAGTFLEDAEVIGVDGIEGTGIHDLAEAIDRMIAAGPARVPGDRPRLWVDRVFAARGAGTVVTGTLTGGGLSVDDELRILPAARTVRVRALQSHHDDLPSVDPGVRVAVNLGGVGHEDLERGDVLVRPSQWHRTATVDAELTVLTDLGHEVSRRGAYLAYIGSRETPVRMRILGPAALTPGATGAVRLYLDQPLPLMVGDRFVLRESGRAETVGGGRVLDPEPQQRAADASPDGSTELLVHERGYVDVDHLERMTGVRPEPDIGRWVADPDRLAHDRERFGAAIADAGPLGLDLASYDERERAIVETLDGVAVEGGRATTGSAVDPLADHPYVAALEATPFQPPDPDGVDRGELRELVRRGTVTEEGGIFFSTTAVDDAARVIAGMLRDQPEGVTVAQVRETLGTTRKYALPLLARLDGTGVTRRRGDVRIGGPRLPDPD